VGLVFASLYQKRGPTLPERVQNQKAGGEKASRNCPRCHSKKIWEDGIREKSQLDRKLLSWRKHLSSGSAFISQGISRIPKNRLKVWTTGDISTLCGNILCYSASRLLISRQAS